MDPFIHFWFTSLESQLIAPESKKFPARRRHQRIVQYIRKTTWSLISSTLSNELTNACCPSYCHDTTAFKIQCFKASPIHTQPMPIYCELMFTTQHAHLDRCSMQIRSELQYKSGIRENEFLQLVQRYLALAQWPLPAPPRFYHCQCTILSNEKMMCFAQIMEVKWLCNV